MTLRVYYDYYDSPLGRMLLTATPKALTGVHFIGEKYYPAIDPAWLQKPRARMIARARKQLREYFLGMRVTFDVPLDPQGTPFQRDVWQELLRIPHGETTHYGEIARRLGNANAMRAVGAANGRNPISIIIPCHRVIGADKGLTGYAGGLARKEALLRLEARVTLARGGFRLTPG
jgi:methylated-DNA-[protein]-cysteine S-methyltransferase